MKTNQSRHQSTSLEKSEVIRLELEAIEKVKGTLPYEQPPPLEHRPLTELKRHALSLLLNVLRSCLRRVELTREVGPGELPQREHEWRKSTGRDIY